MKTYFSHEKLEAYQQSLAFAAWCEPILEALPKAAAVHNQLDRARTSIPLNLAEGNAKFTAADKCRYFDTAHGSTVECAACLDLLFIGKVLTEAKLDEGKILLSGLVALITGLIKSKIPDRFNLREDEGDYLASTPTPTLPDPESESEKESGNEKESLR